ncbi:MAG TPA: hypothetical protein VGQ83_31835 [Polyangia bacterium]|jgi:hypothetical protein
MGSAAPVLFTPQVLTEVATARQIDSLRPLAEELRASCFAPLWSAVSAADLELREESAAATFWRISVEACALLQVAGVSSGELFELSLQYTRRAVPQLMRRLARDTDLYCARSFERCWGIVVEVMEGVAPLAAQIDVATLVRELPERVWFDPLFRDVVVGQTHLAGVSAAAEVSSPLPAVTREMCARAHRYLTSYLELAMLVDPRLTGLLRPRHHPLRHAAFRASEEEELEQRLRCDPQLRARLQAALASTPEIVE